MYKLRIPIGVKVVAIIVPILFLSFPVRASNPAHIQQLLQTKVCQNCDLTGADLKDALLVGADLRGANLSKANLDGALLVAVNLASANLSDGSLQHVDLSGANLRGANLSRANLSYSEFEGAQLNKAILQQANLSNALLSSTDFSNADLTEVIFKDARGNDVQMKSVNLQKAGFERASLSGDFSNANLKEAMLSDASLMYSNLTNANLTNVDLTNASLYRTTLDKATLTGVIWKGTNLIKATGLTLQVKQELIKEGVTTQMESGASTEIVASADQLKVNLSYRRETGETLPLTLQVIRRGEPLPKQQLILDKISYGALGLRVLDLDGDKEPEILADFFSGGAHCCSYSLVFRYDPRKQQYISTIHNWRDTGYQLKDFDADGLPEFEGRDLRFAYHFSSFAASRFPVRIWQYRQGKFIDVTRRHPKRVLEQANEFWQEYVAERQNLLAWQQYGGSDAARAALAAYMANQYLLGKEQEGWQRLQQSYNGSNSAVDFTVIKNFLQSTGYAPNPALKIYLSRVLSAESGLKGSKHQVVVSPDGQLLVTLSSSNSIFTVTGSNTVQIWNLKTGRLLRTTLRQLKADVLQLAISLDRTKLALLNGDGVIELWNLNTGKLLSIIRKNTAYQVLQFDSQNQLIGIEWDVNKHNKDQTIINIVNLTASKKLKTLAWDHVKRGELMTVSLDGKIVVSVSCDHKIQLWNQNASKILRTLPGHVYNFRSITLSLNKERLISDSNDDSIKVWNVKTGVLITTIPDSNDYEHIKSSSVSADGQSLVKADNDGKIKIWRFALSE